MELTLPMMLPTSCGGKRTTVNPQRTDRETRRGESFRSLRGLKTETPLSSSTCFEWRRKGGGSPSASGSEEESHLSVHEEAQRERDSHRSVSKLLLAAHGGGGGGGGVVGGGVGALCHWETHEGPRPPQAYGGVQHFTEKRLENPAEENPDP